jgi:hypothetical protein
MASRLRLNPPLSKRSWRDKVNTYKKLASQFAVVVAVAMLFGMSVFAEERHRDGTNRSGEQRTWHQRSADSGGTQESSRSGAQNFERNRQNAQQSRPAQSFDRTTPQSSYDHRGDTRRNNDYRNNNNRGNNNNDYRNNNNRGNNNNDYRNNNRGNNNNDHGNYDRNRNNNRNNGNWRGNDHRGSSRDYGYRGSPYRAHGRISRIDRYRDGYRIYVGGARYPFFMPEARFRLFGWRVGIDVALGGYYNPLGYYDYYDDSYYDGGSAYSAGSLRGVIETVDYRRSSFVLRDDASGGFVTVIMRGADRRFDTLRPGDYISVDGDFTQGGLFEAYRADLIGDADYRR